MIEFLYILGAVASIASAIYAGFQAFRARGYKQQISSVLLNRRRIQDLSSLLEEVERLRPVIQKYGPSASPIVGRGANLQRDLRMVDEFFSRANTLRSSFPNPEEVQGRVAQIRDLIRSALHPPKGREAEDFTREIYSRVGDFNALIRNYLNAESERLEG